MQKIKINCYTDESGQDTRGKTFVVSTVICLSEEAWEIEKRLLEVEKKSGKSGKWYDTGNKRRHQYIRILQEGKTLSKTQIYYSIFNNKNEYLSLTASHIAKAILMYTNDRKYVAKIFVDKMDKSSMNKIKKEIKLIHIRYAKIRGLSEKSSSFIRLADAICGLIRDLNNKNVANSYKVLFSKAKEV